MMCDEGNSGTWWETLDFDSSNFVLQIDWNLFEHFTLGVFSDF
jgi:hypothetical protein